MRTRSPNSKEITQLIEWGGEQCHKISESSRLDAEILLTYVLNKPRSYCRTWPDKEVSSAQINAYKELIAQRLKPTPIAYLIGYKEFWSRDFAVDSSTLIPRPETELLIETALFFLNRDKTPKTVLDLGTGTGCIAITLQKEAPNSQVTAVDASRDALKMAKKNALQHKSNIQFIESNWFEQLHKSYDLIVSNPPYIAQYDEHLRLGDLPAEPISALASGIDGLDDIRHITKNAGAFLKPNGMLMIEHGYDQREAVLQLFDIHGFGHIEQFSDLSQQDRLTIGISR